MASLYEEQIRAEDTAYAMYTEHGSDSQAEASTYFPELPDYDGGVSGHLETLRRASEALDIPVIASLNGTTAEGWVEHARSLEQAGAAAIELNVYSMPVDLAVSGAEVERRYVDIVRERQGERPHSDRRQARAVLLVAGAHGGGTGAGRRGRPGALQPLLRAGHRPPHASRDEIAALVHGRRAAALARLDRAPVAPPRVFARGRPRCRDGCRGRQVPARGRGRRHDRLGAAAARAGARGDDARRGSNAGSARTASTRSTRSAA